MLKAIKVKNGFEWSLHPTRAKPRKAIFRCGLSVETRVHAVIIHTGYHCVSSICFGHWQSNAGTGRRKYVTARERRQQHKARGGKSVETLDVGPETAQQPAKAARKSTVATVSCMTRGGSTVQ